MKVLIGCVSFTPVVFGFTKAEQDLHKAVTTEMIGNQGGNATVPISFDLEAVKKALATGANVNTMFPDIQNSTVLHAAVMANNLAGVEFLLKNKANVNIKNANGDTPGHIAARQAILNILDILIKNGVDLKIKNKDGKTIPEVLLVGASGRIGGNQGGNATTSTPLNLEATKKALELGANINTVLFDSYTLLHQAVKSNDAAAIEFLLKNKANVNARDVDGNTPAHIAAQQGNKTIVDLLAKYGADLKIKNKEGKTAKDLLAVPM